MIISILPNAQTAEDIINNLVEQDFEEKNISLILQNDQDARKIIDDGGPLKGVTSKKLPSILKKNKLSSPDIQVFINALNTGKAVLAINSTPQTQNAITETLQDAHSILTKVVA